MSTTNDRPDLAAVRVELAAWDVTEERLERSFRFRDAVAAFAFLAAVGMLSERAGHHPEIHAVYRDVTLRLTTHDAGDVVTERDVALARGIDAHLAAS